MNQGLYKKLNFNALALSVVDRLIIKDLLKTFFSVLLVLVVIVVSREFLKTLKMAANGLISNDVVLELLSLRILVSSSEFMVPSAFVTVLMVIGRMYRDHEMSTLASAGVGVFKIYQSVYKAIIPIILLSIGMVLFVSPWAKTQGIEILYEQQQKAGIRGISPGRFTEYGKGSLIFYAETVTADDKMHDVFVQDKRGDKVGIITANSAELREVDEGLFLVFLEGKRVQGEPGQLDYAFETFSEYAMRIEDAAGQARISIHGLGTQTLLQSDKLEEISELFRRLFVPIAIFILTLMAVPLAQISPRGGVYGNVLTAFLIYFSFSNFQQVILSWMVKGEIPVWLGFWGIYLVSALLVVFLIIRLYGLPWIILCLRGKAI